MKIEIGDNLALGIIAIVVMAAIVIMTVYAIKKDGK